MKIRIFEMILLIIAFIFFFICVIQKNKEQETKTITKLNQWIYQNYSKILLVILVLGILVRLMGIGEVPKGIHIDEAGMAYDAYSISEYGTDRYGNQFPLYLENFGQGQSVMCMYLISPFIKLFGLNLYSIRIPIAMVSILAMILAYLLVKEKKEKKTALLFLFLLAICPWHIMQARWALDCNLLSSFMIFSTYAILKAKRKIGYVGAGILVGLTLYTYVLSYIIVPIFLLLLLSYCLYLKKIKLTDIIVMGIPIFLLALPLLYMVFMNQGILPQIDLSFVSIPNLTFYRANEIGISNIKDNLNIFSILLFGDDMMYNVPYELGTIYYLSIPFFFMGLCLAIANTIKSIRKKEFDFDTIMLITFISVLICMLLITEPKVNKANAIFISIIYFTATGLIFIFKQRKIFFYLTIELYLISFIVFEVYYFTAFANNTDITYRRYFDNELISLTSYLEENYPERTVYFSMQDKKEPYIYTLIGNPISPEEFKNSMKRINGTVVSYNNYIFYNQSFEDKDGIYILEETEQEEIEYLIQNQFQVKEFGKYRIVYREI